MSAAARRPRPHRDARPGAAARSRLRAGAFAIALAVIGIAAAPSPVAADAGSRGEAIEQALARSGGRGKVLGVREERDANGVVYAVKVLTDGRVRVYRIRARR